VLASLGVALVVAFGSALVPLINIELFVIALVAREPSLPWLAAGATVAVGQVAGKLLYYFAARGWLRLPAFLHRRRDANRPITPRRVKWQQWTKRMRTWMDNITEKCHQHPHWMAGTYAVSSVIGIPPYMATTILAGLARMSLLAFITTGIIGRSIRFCALAASPGLVTQWW